MIPKTFLDFKEKFPEIIEYYDKLADKTHTIGPLDDKTRRLIKLTYAIAIGSEGGTHAQVRKALKNAISEEEIYQTVLLGLTTIGFPRTHAAFTWVNDVLYKKK